MKKLLLAIITVCLFLAPSYIGYAGSYPIVKYRALDNDGDPISGGKLYFYKTSTTTPYDTYSDEALTSANANPVVADGNGWFGSIYMDPDQEYKVKLTDASDNQIWVVDNINANSLVSSDLSTRLKQATSNPLDYRSAVGDGAADEYLAVQDAIDNRVLVVDLLGKTFRCDSAITLNSNIILRNGTLDFSNSTDDTFISSAGSRGSAVTLSSDADPGDVQIVVSSASGIATNDWLYVYSTANWAGTDISGELVQVESVSGTTVQIDHPLQGEYLTANTASIREITMDTNIRLENLIIIASTTQSGTGDVLSLSDTERVVIDNVKFQGIKNAGVLLNESVDVKITNSTFDNDNGSGNGIRVRNHSRDVFIDRNTFRKLDTGVEIGGADGTYNDGVTRWVLVKDNTFYGNEYGVDIEDSSHHIQVSGNTIISDLVASSSNIRSAGVDIKINNNSLDGGLYGVELSWAVSAITGDERSIQVYDNDIDDSYSSGVVLATTAAIEGVRVDGNTITGGSTGSVYAIDLSFAQTALNISVSGNDIDMTKDNAVEGIQLNCDHANGVSNVVISGNTVKVTTNEEALNFTQSAGSFSNVTISGNSFIGSTHTGYGVYLEDISNLLFSGNSIIDMPTWYTSGSTSVEGVTFSGNQLSGAYALQIHAGTAVSIAHLTVSGNSLENTNTAYNGLLINGTIANAVTYVTITGNTITGSGQDGILFNTNNTNGTINYAIVSGNIIEAVGFCIGEEGDDPDVTNVVAGNNVYIGCPNAIEFPASTGGDFGDGTIFNVGDIKLDSITADATGIGVTIGGEGGTSTESIEFNFGDTDNQVDVSSTTGVTTVDFGTLNLATDALDVSDGDILNVNDIHTDRILADGTYVNYLDVDQFEIRQGDLDVGSCTTGQLALDIATTKELCYCAASNTWYCWSATTVNGPTD